MRKENAITQFDCRGKVSLVMDLRYPLPTFQARSMALTSHHVIGAADKFTVDQGDEVVKY